MKYPVLFLGLTLISAFGQAAMAEQPVSNTLAANVRDANRRFVDVSVAVAEGYAPIPCASGRDGGGMGIHYVSAKYLKDDAIDLAHPEAVMYEPETDRKLKLVAVEYITSKGPAELQGNLFNFTPAPNRYGLGPFYELHVWAWKRNHKGTFADDNPDVSCEAMKPSSGRIRDLRTSQGQFGVLPPFAAEPRLSQAHRQKIAASVYSSASSPTLRPRANRRTG